MSNKRHEYEVWELEVCNVTSKWRLVATLPTKAEAEELVFKLDHEKNMDCYPYYEEDYIYRIKRVKKKTIQE